MSRRGGSLRERLASARSGVSRGGGFRDDEEDDSRYIPGLGRVSGILGGLDNRAESAMKGARSTSRWMTDKEGHPGVEWSRNMAGIGGSAADDMKGSIWDSVMGRLGEKGIYRDEGGTWRIGGATGGVPSPGLGGVPSGDTMMTGGGFPSAAGGQNQAMRSSMFGEGFPFNQGDGMIGGRPVSQGPYTPGKTMTSVGGTEPALPGVRGVPGTANTGPVPVFPQPGLGGSVPPSGPVYNPPTSYPAQGQQVGSRTSPPPYPPGGQGVGSTSAVRQGEIPAPPPSTSTTNQGTYTPSGQTTVITAKDGKQYSIDPNTGYATEVPAGTTAPAPTQQQAPPAQYPSGGSSPSPSTKGPYGAQEMAPPSQAMGPQGGQVQNSDGSTTVYDPQGHKTTTYPPYDPASGSSAPWPNVQYDTGWSPQEQQARRQVAPQGGGWNEPSQQELIAGGMQGAGLSAGPIPPPGGTPVNRGEWIPQAGSVPGAGNQGNVPPGGYPGAFPPPGGGLGAPSVPVRPGSRPLGAGSIPVPPGTQGLGAPQGGPVGGGYDPSMQPRTGVDPSLQGFVSSPQTAGGGGQQYAPPAGGGQPIASTPPEYAGMVQTAADTHGVPANILSAMLQSESNWDPNAVSPAGAVGLGQFMPDTAAGMGINPSDPAQAIDGAARYLKQNYDQFGSWELALAAYNAGPGAVQQAGNQIPPYAETQAYVPRVMGLAGPVDQAQAAAPAAAGAAAPGGMTPSDEQLSTIVTGAGLGGNQPAPPGAAPATAPAAAPSGVGAPTGTIPVGNITGGGNWDDVNYYDDTINAAAAAHGVDPAWLKSMMIVESGGNPLAEGEGGAAGIMQIKSGHWQDQINQAGLPYDLSTADGQIMAAAAILGGDVPQTAGKTVEQAFLEDYYPTGGMDVAGESGHTPRMYLEDIAMYSEIINGSGGGMAPAAVPGTTTAPPGGSAPTSSGGVPTEVGSAIRMMETGGTDYTGQQNCDIRPESGCLALNSGIFESTAQSYGLDYNRIVNDQAYADYSIGVIMNGIATQDASNFNGPSGMTVYEWGEQNLPGGGWEATARVYFGGDVTGQFVDEQGRSGATYGQQFMGRLGGAPAGGPGTASVPPGQVAPSGQAPVSPGGGQQGGQQPSMTNTGLDTTVRNMMLGNQGGLSGIGDQIRQQVAGQLGQAGLGQERQSGGVAGMPNMSGLGDQIRQQVAGQMGRAGIGGPGGALGGRDLGAEIRGKVQGQLGQAGLGGVGQTGGALGGRDIGADIRQRVAMQLERAGLGGVGQIGGSGRGVTASTGGGVPPGPAGQIAGVSPAAGGYPAPAAQPAPAPAPAAQPAPAPAPAPAATPQTVDATGEAAATSQPQYITAEDGKTYAIDADGTATPVQMTEAADGKTYAVDETGYATEIAPAATEGTYNAAPAATGGDPAAQKVTSQTTPPAEGADANAPVGPQNQTRVPVSSTAVNTTPATDGMGEMATPETDESWMAKAHPNSCGQYECISTEYKQPVTWEVPALGECRYCYQNGHGADGSTHAAYDIAGSYGDPVNTPVDGKVICAGGGVGSGAEGWNCSYAIGCTFEDSCGAGQVSLDVGTDAAGNQLIWNDIHLSGSSVQDGQQVKAGEQIGSMGSMGGMVHTHTEALAICNGTYVYLDPTLVANGYYSQNNACAGY